MSNEDIFSKIMKLSEDKRDYLTPYYGDEKYKKLWHAKSPLKEDFDKEGLERVSKEANAYLQEILDKFGGEWSSSEEYRKLETKTFESDNWKVVVDPLSMDCLELGYYFMCSHGIGPLWCKEYKINQKYDYNTETYLYLVVKNSHRGNMLKYYNANGGDELADWTIPLRMIRDIEF